MCDVISVYIDREVVLALIVKERSYACSFVAKIGRLNCLENLFNICIDCSVLYAKNRHRLHH